MTNAALKQSKLVKKLFFSIKIYKKKIKKVIFFIFFGGAIGGLYGNFAGPVYEGTLHVSPLKIMGDNVVSPKIMQYKLSIDSFYTFDYLSACNLKNSKDTRMSDLIKTNISLENNFLSVSYENKDKSVITNCLKLIEKEIIKDQQLSAIPIIKEKNSQIYLLQKNIKSFKSLNENLTPKKKITSEENILNLIKSKNYIFAIQRLENEINNIKFGLSESQKKYEIKLLPIDFKKKKYRH